MRISRCLPQCRLRRPSRLQERQRSRRSRLFKVIQLWVALWRQADPAFGYFGEYVKAGNTYSPDRFLTLYKAAENYWKRVTAEPNWKLPKLRARASIQEAVSHCGNDAIALMGRLRKYHGHLGDQAFVSVEFSLLVPIICASHKRQWRPLINAKVQNDLTHVTHSPVEGASSQAPRSGLPSV